MMIVYMATNKINGKQYIGQTVGKIEERRSRHIYEAKNKTHKTYFHRAIRKYGLENFDWEVLDSARNIDELNELEIYFIKLFKTFGEGYNLNDGGLNALTSKETKRKISESNKKRNIGMSKIEKYFIWFLYEKFNMRGADIAEIAGVSTQCVFKAIRDKIKKEG